MTKKTRTIRCFKCGKETVMPDMTLEKTRNEVLSPFYCASTAFSTQWLIHHGWHVRNLGLTDNHPYFCPDCFEEGTPEYEARAYGKQWCEQAESWLNGRPTNAATSSDPLATKKMSLM